MGMSNFLLPDILYDKGSISRSRGHDEIRENKKSASESFATAWPGNDPPALRKTWFPSRSRPLIGCKHRSTRKHVRSAIVAHHYHFVQPIPNNATPEPFSEATPASRSRRGILAAFTSVRSRKFAISFAACTWRIHVERHRFLPQTK